MLSRFSLNGTQGVTRCLLVKYQPATFVSTSSSDASQNPGESGQRDLTNFPRQTRPMYAPPTRFGFIPDSFFRYFYPKTGVTGPYIFMGSVGTYLLSKEIIVLDHNINHTAAYLVAMMIFYYKFGDKIGAWYNKELQNQIDNLDKPQKDEKLYFKNAIETLEGKKKVKEVVSELVKAKREGVYLQMEAAYRQRLAQAHQMVKKRLDCLIELQNAEKRISHKNLVDYVVRNVMSSLTADQEKATLQQCIKDLNTLSAKA